VRRKRRMSKEKKVVKKTGVDLEIKKMLYSVGKEVKFIDDKLNGMELVISKTDVGDRACYTVVVKYNLIEEERRKFFKIIMDKRTLETIDVVGNMEEEFDVLRTERDVNWYIRTSKEKENTKVYSIETCERNKKTAYKVVLEEGKGMWWLKLFIKEGKRRVWRAVNLVGIDQELGNN
jgi:hypothetical protein